MPRTRILLAGLLLLIAGCGGHPGPGAGGSPGSTGPGKVGFTFHPVAPHADPLPYDGSDEARNMVSPQGHRDGAGVFVYANVGPHDYVLLARRAPWLSGSGTWGVFGGSVETSDLDSTGRMSYARAAEHELYEESVTVYHQTDANDLRACPTHLKYWKSGMRFRTFFSRQPYIPAEIFDQGYAFAVAKGLPHHYRENDQYRWVLLEDLKACASARQQTFDFTDVHGVKHSLQLFDGFYRALSSKGYLQVLNALP